MAKLPGLAANPTPTPATGGVSYRPTGVWNSVAQLAGEVYEVAEQEKDRRDKLVVEDKLNQILQEQMELTRSEERGFQNIRGGDAVNGNLAEDYTKRFDSFYNGIAQGLNPRQSQMLKARYDDQRLSLTDSIYSHVLQQKRVYHKNVYDNQIMTEAQMAGQNYLDPDAIAAGLVRVEDGAATYSDSEGHDPKLREGERLKAVRVIHDVVIKQALADGNTKFVREYIKNKAYGKDIDPLTMAEIRKDIADVEFLGDVQSEEDRIMAAHPNDPAAARAAARKVADPKKRDALVSRVNARIQQNELNERDAEEGFLEAMWGKTMQPGGFNNLNKQEQARVMQVSPAAYESMRGFDPERPPPANRGFVYQLQRQATSDDESERREFAKMSLTPYMDKIGDKWDHLVTLQMQVRKEFGLASAKSAGAGDTEMKYIETKSDSALFDSYVRGLGINPNTTDKKESAKIRDLNKRYDFELELYQRLNEGKEPSPREKRAILDELTYQYMRENTMEVPLIGEEITLPWGAKGLGYELTIDAETATKMNQPGLAGQRIPVTDLANIRTALGMIIDETPSEKNVLAMYSTGIPTSILPDYVLILRRNNKVVTPEALKALYEADKARTR